MNSIYRDAILKAAEVRKLLGVNMFQPINIFDSCLKLDIDVKFVDINMEGFYINQNGNATILISNLRPLPRRSFTCGHELGHHVFNHGLKVDILNDETATNYKDKDEILVDAFSAALLMPIGGIQSQFLKRNIDIMKASPIDFYFVASVYGVGYQTLVTHCKVHNLISETKASTLIKMTPAKIFKSAFPTVHDKSHYKIIDKNSNLSTIDLEVSNYLLLPYDFVCEPLYLSQVVNVDLGILYKVIKPGISTVQSSDGSKSYFVRAQKPGYVGFAEYRHFEN